MRDRDNAILANLLFVLWSLLLMNALWKWLLFCAILLWFFVIQGNVAHAQIEDNQSNPLVTPKHSGGADQVAVIGLEDASNQNGGQEDALINVVKWWVNRVLGILGLIALLILMYGGFLMVTSAGEEEQYKKGRTILKHAVIGLIIIGVAWFVVSIVFWLVNKTTTIAWPANTDT